MFQGGHGGEEKEVEDSRSARLEGWLGCDDGKSIMFSQVSSSTIHRIEWIFSHLTTSVTV